jgi:8-amino-7-oxononanoate synthase
MGNADESGVGRVRTDGAGDILDDAKAAALGFMRTRRQDAAPTAPPSPSISLKAARCRPGQGFDGLPEYRQIEAHRAAGRLLALDDPFYRAHQAAAGATALIEGRRLTNFASYDYLGLNSHPDAIAEAKAALDAYAVSASASRLVGGERVIHRELERLIAALYRADDALSFVSGYLTNLAVIGCLMGPEDLVIHDQYIHNSALAGIKLSGAARRFFSHNDLGSLSGILETAAGSFRRTLVVVEGLYSMDGDLPDLPGLIRLREQYGFWLMVDEAHALGVLGEEGRGSAEHFGCDPAGVDIWMGTMSKTTSSCGGYIAGTQALIDILRANAGGFVYSVGMAPVLAAAALANLRTMQREPQRRRLLKENARYFKDRARQAGLDTGLSMGFAVVPVIVGDSVRAVKLANDLFEGGVNVLPIIHPAVPEGMARLRFFVTSAHTREQMDMAVDLTARLLRKLEEEDFGIGSLDIGTISRLIG